MRADRYQAAVGAWRRERGAEVRRAVISRCQGEIHGLLRRDGVLPAEPVSDIHVRHFCGGPMLRGEDSRGGH